VRDEGREHHGRTAIRAWVEETSRRYNPKASVTALSEAQGKLIAAVQIFGDFPVVDRVTYAFTLRDGKIARLEITA